MANFIELHHYNSNEPIFVNMDVIEIMSDCSECTELIGIKHWSAYKVRENVEEIIKKMKEGK